MRSENYKENTILEDEVIELGVDEVVEVKEPVVRRGPNPAPARYKRIRNEGIQTVAPQWRPVVQDGYLMGFGWLHPVTGRLWEQVGAPAQLPPWATGVANICGVWFWARHGE